MTFFRPADLLNQYEVDTISMNHLERALGSNGIVLIYVTNN